MLNSTLLFGEKLKDEYVDHNVTLNLYHSEPFMKHESFYHV